MFFEGTIESAIALAKQKNAIFVVYCAGEKIFFLLKRNFTIIIFFPQEKIRIRKN
jgi:hypothetical protein